MTNDLSIERKTRAELHTYIDPALKRQLAHLAVDRKVRQGAIIDEALSLYFEHEEPTSAVPDAFSEEKAGCEL